MNKFRAVRTQRGRTPWLLLAEAVEKVPRIRNLETMIQFLDEIESIAPKIELNRSIVPIILSAPTFSTASATSGGSAMHPIKTAFPR